MAIPIVLDFLYLTLSIFYLPNFLFKGKFRKGFLERFGIYGRQTRNAFSEERPFIWLHAVSVGEIKAASSLIEKLRGQFPKARFLISTITTTGNSVARQIAEKEDIVIYFPFDLSFVTRRALTAIKPKLILIVETEIWPGFIQEAAKRNIPLVMVNGRLSDKAFPRYKLAALFFKTILKKINLFCMQTEKDAKRILALGAEKGKVYVIGNLKFDQVKKPAQEFILGLGLKNTEKLIVAGSTHAGEEEILVRVFLKLKKEFPEIRLLIAPRHPQRTKDIERLLKDRRLNHLLISKINQTKAALATDAIFILDLMGVLNQIYNLAEIVFIGGSLMPHGGHNPIEPAICAKAIVFGKYMFNFAEIAKIFQDGQAALCVDSEQKLHETLKTLLKDQRQRAKLAASAKELVLKNQGCAERILALVNKKLLIPFSFKNDKI